MKRLYAFCLITLLAVAADVLYFHAAPAHAQNKTSTVRIRKVANMTEVSTVTLGEGQSVQGFQCVQENITLTQTCFILTAGQ